MISHIYSGGSLLFHLFLFEQEKDLTVFVSSEKRSAFLSKRSMEIKLAVFFSPPFIHNRRM